MSRVLIIIVLTMLLLASGLYAQTSKEVTYADKKQIEDFFKSTTMVALENNSMIGYNIAIEEAVKKYWSITPYEIIAPDQFDKMRTDPKFSFIFLSKVQLQKDKQKVYYLYLNVVMGAKVKNLTDMPELLSLPLAYTEIDEDEYLDKLPLMVRFAQVHLNNLKNAKDPKKLYELKNYSDESKLLKDRTLLVTESDLAEEVNTVEKIRKEYPGIVKIVTSEEIVKAIEEQTPNTAVLHQIGPGEDEKSGRSYREIFGTDDAKLYYYNHQTITQKRPAGMLARDFRLILGKWF